MAEIIVADDVPMMCQLAAAILKNAGHTVYEVHSGQALIKKIQEIPEIELALVDIGMPDLNGIQAAKQLRSERDVDQLKICFVSGNRDKKTVVEALQNGGNDYIMKPIDPEILLSKVRKLLGITDQAQFASIPAALQAEIVGIPFKATLKIFEISEVSAMVESPFELTESSMIDLESTKLNQLFEEQAVLKCKVTRCEKKKDLFVSSCEFVGMVDGVRDKIRALVIKAQKLTEDS
ncbi:MAG: response regulator [Zetaproteobacteria bacterium]|nr:response regulator [Zetaproteobacteria bacterium]